MANPEPANEPSMEEILASIRRIISDDDDGNEGEAAAADEAPASEAVNDDEQVDFDAVGTEAEDEPGNDSPVEPEAPEAAAPASDDNDQSGIDDIFELTDVVEDDEPEVEAASDAPAEDDFASMIGDDPENAADIDFVDTEAMAGGYDFDTAPEPELKPSSKSHGPSLLSPDAQATASAAFGALASTMLSHSGGARTLEEIVEDLLRPLLKAWLDQNLPPLVERLVREEIERVARRGH